MSLKSDIEKGLWDELSESAQRKAEKYLNTSRLGRGGKLKVTRNEEVYAQARKDYGYFALVSNEAEDYFEALRKYRLREKIEEAFKDTKNRLDGSRMGRRYAQGTHVLSVCRAWISLLSAHENKGTQRTA